VEETEGEEDMLKWGEAPLAEGLVLGWCWLGGFGGSRSVQMREDPWSTVREEAVICGLEGGVLGGEEEQQGKEGRLRGLRDLRLRGGNGDL
jgi:hypothetical protein